MRANLRPLMPRETDWEKFAAAALPLAAAGGIAWLKLGLPLPSCLFKHLTGHPCCGCGSTRASHALLCGRLSEALSLNPLATLAAAALVCLWGYATLCVVAANGRRLRFDGATQTTRRALRIAAMAAFAANWAWVLTHLPESPWKIL